MPQQALPQQALAKFKYAPTGFQFESQISENSNMPQQASNCNLPQQALQNKMPQKAVTIFLPKGLNNCPKGLQNLVKQSNTD